MSAIAKVALREIVRLNEELREERLFSETLKKNVRDMNDDDAASVAYTDTLCAKIDALRLELAAKEKTIAALQSRQSVAADMGLRKSVQAFTETADELFERANAVIDAAIPDEGAPEFGKD